MARIYLPSTGPHDWQWLLAKPGLQWSHGASAMAMADAWEQAEGWPQPVSAAIARSDQLADLDLLVAFPEYKVPLPGGLAASQTDLFVLARSPTNGLVAMAIEGKASEPFGDRTVSQWRMTDTTGRRNG